jgi:hypothetical protein
MILNQMRELRLRNYTYKCFSLPDRNQKPFPTSTKMTGNSAKASENKCSAMRRSFDPAAAPGLRAQPVRR